MICYTGLLHLINMSNLFDHHIYPNSRLGQPANQPFIEYNLKHPVANTDRGVEENGYGRKRECLFNTACHCLSPPLPSPPLSCFHIIFSFNAKWGWRIIQKIMVKRNQIRESVTYLNDTRMILLLILVICHAEYRVLTLKRVYILKHTSPHLERISLYLSQFLNRME